MGLWLLNGFLMGDFWRCVFWGWGWSVCWREVLWLFCMRLAGEEIDGELLQVYDLLVAIHYSPSLTSFHTQPPGTLREHDLA